MARGKKGKGKVPKGRAGAKQKAQKSAGDRSWTGAVYSNRMARHGLADLDDEDDDPSSIRPGFRGFAQLGNGFGSGLRDFALRNVNVKLRDQAITFVSAGVNAPMEIEQENPDVEVAMDNEDEDEEDEEEEDDDEVEEDGSDIDAQGGDLLTNIVMEADVVVPEADIEHMTMDGTADSDTGGLQNGNSVSRTRNDNAKTADSLPFIVDTIGDATLATDLASKKRDLTRHVASPTPSDSSEEVVVFHGRNKPRIVDDPIRSPPVSMLAVSASTSIDKSSEQPAPDSNADLTNDLLKFLQKSAEADSLDKLTPTSSSGIPARGWGSQPSKFAQGINTDAIWAPAPVGKWKKGMLLPDLEDSRSSDLIDDALPPKLGKVAFTEPDKEVEKGAGETIASLQAELRKTLRENRLAKLEGEDASSDNAKGNRRRKRGRRRDNRILRGAITDEDEDEEDDDAAGEAAYDDYMANLVAQMDADDCDEVGTDAFLASAFARSSDLDGPSVVVDGKEIGDDEVLDSSRYVTNDESSDDSSNEIIGQDLDDTSDEARLNLSDLDSSELEDELEYTEREQWEDEEDLRQRRQDRMTDEQIARLLAKQEELGIEGDELILEDGTFPPDTDGVGDVDAARAGLDKMYIFDTGPTQAAKARRRSKRGRGDFSFPDASAFADTVDQYGVDGFDIMDFDRPSLRTKKKGRKGKLPPELEAVSDDDLREAIRDTWENDRSKKQAKKQEREELRMLGLLGAGGRSGKADLGQKYQNGMSTTQIHEELRIFLQDDGQQSRPFPPMNKVDRKALHEIANALNLKSLSRGAGKDRFPVVYKTSRTVRYSEAAFNHTMARASKGYLTFGRGTAKKGKKAGRAGAGGGFSSAAVGIRHGEVVGAGAAEIGKENFGHKLMEKMGWSKGMALGKEGEGRLLPVEQVMRAGKAGLG